MTPATPVIVEFIGGCWQDQGQESHNSIADVACKTRSRITSPHSGLVHYLAEPANTPMVEQARFASGPYAFCV